MTQIGANAAKKTTDRCLISDCAKTAVRRTGMMPVQIEICHLTLPNDHKRLVLLAAQKKNRHVMIRCIRLGLSWTDRDSQDMVALAQTANKQCTLPAACLAWPVAATSNKTQPDTGTMNRCGSGVQCRSRQAIALSQHFVIGTQCTVGPFLMRPSSGE